MINNSEQKNHGLGSVLIVGNCVVDEIWRLADYPVEDSEQRAGERIRRPGGNACNTALMLAALGQRVTLLSQFADDANGSWLRQCLENADIDLGSSPVVPGSTPTSCIWVNESNGSRTIVHHRDLPELPLASLQACKWSAYAWIHLEGRNIDVLREMMPEIRKSSNASISLEIEKARDGIESLLPWIDVAIVSSHYLRARGITSEQVITEFVALNSQMLVVCTEGNAGVTWAEGDQLHRIAARQINNCVDTIGAGDSFIAGLIDACLRGKDSVAALDFANRLAASKIQHQGMNFNRDLIGGRAC